jgi:hypothetical protein
MYHIIPNGNSVCTDLHKRTPVSVALHAITRHSKGHVFIAIYCRLQECESQFHAHHCEENDQTVYTACKEVITC